MNNPPQWLILLRQRDPERAKRLEAIGDSLEESAAAIGRAKAHIEKLRIT